MVSSRELRISTTSGESIKIAIVGSTEKLFLGEDFEMKTDKGLKNICEMIREKAAQ